MNQAAPASSNASNPAARLQELGITLPSAGGPAAAYVPFTLTENTLYISGQLPLVDGKPANTGKLGDNISLEEGQEIARICAINVLGHANTALNGDLDRIKRFLKLEILVAAKPEFTTPHVVANGASQLILDVFGEEVGSHARVAYGVSVLPMDVPVEVAATIAL